MCDTIVKYCSLFTVAKSTASPIIVWEMAIGLYLEQVKIYVCAITFLVFEALEQ